MKLATYKDGARDGQLVVVSRDLALACYPSRIANRLQDILDDWNYFSPQLQEVYDGLNAGRLRQAFPFDPAQCMAPLPRAYQWVEGAAYPQARDQLLPQGPAAPAHPAMRQGASDALGGAWDPIRVAGGAGAAVDFEAQLAVVTGDIPHGCAADSALEGVRLLMLANAVALRDPAADAAADRGVQCNPPPSFSPVAVTTDELGDAWRRGRVHLTLQCSWNGRKVGLCNAGAGMAFHFGQLIERLARVRNLRAGSIIGSGTVSNPGVGKKGSISWPAGYSCIAEKRAMELLQDGMVHTSFLQPGDTIRIEMKTAGGDSLFGAIAQEVLPPLPA